MFSQQSRSELASGSRKAAGKRRDDFTGKLTFAARHDSYSRFI
jgi:hypothetical protein